LINLPAKSALSNQLPITCREILLIAIAGFMPKASKGGESEVNSFEVAF